MRLFWLGYESEDTRCVLIKKAGTLITAQLKANMAHDIDRWFGEATSCRDRLAATRARIASGVGQRWAAERG